MSIPILNTSTGLFTAVGGVSAQIGAMTATAAPGVEMWQFTSTTNCWIAQGVNPTATAGAGSSLVLANFPILIDATFGAKLAVIQDTVAGKASLTRVMLVNR